MTTTTSTLPRPDTRRVPRRRSARGTVGELRSALSRLRGALAAAVETGQLGVPADVEVSRLTGARI
jgi:hypothetical protein